MIKEKFMLDVPIVIISFVDLSDALDNAPAWWDCSSDEEVIHQAIFLIPPVTIKEVYGALKEAKPAYERLLIIRM